MLFTWTFEGQTCFTVFVSNELTYNFCQRKNLTKYWKKNYSKKTEILQIERRKTGSDWIWCCVSSVSCFCSKKCSNFFFLLFDILNYLEKKCFRYERSLIRVQNAFFVFVCLRAFSNICLPILLLWHIAYLAFSHNKAGCNPFISSANCSIQLLKERKKRVKYDK